MKITKGTANTITVTLTEKTTISSPRYLFEFKSDSTNEYTYCLVGTDLSTHQERFNQFVITETTSPDYSAAEIELSVGEYEYKAYELTSVQAAALDFNDIDTSTYTCVEGACVARVYASSDTTYTQYPATTINTVYEG